MLELRVAIRFSNVFATEAWIRVGAPFLAGLSYFLSRWLH
jgi:hypothetical protein